MDFSNYRFSFLVLILFVIIVFGAGCGGKQYMDQKSPMLPAQTEPLPASAPSASSLPQPSLPSTLEVQPPPPASSVTQPFVFRSSAFSFSGVIPEKYSCDGADVNPPLSWSGAPSGTKSFALIVDDPDAVPVIGRVADHWILWNIPATTKSIAEGSVPAHASQGASYSARKYQGPCPPSVSAHRYFFKLYALDIERLDLSSSTSGRALEAVLQGHILKKVEFIGRYTAR